MTRNGIHRLEVGGPILGVFADARFQEETLRVSQGDSLTMFTDGVPDARNAIDQEFGDERLTACLRTASALPPSEMLSAIFGAVRSFCGDAEQSDDITVTVTRFVAESPA